MELQKIEQILKDTLNIAKSMHKVKMHILV